MAKVPFEVQVEIVSHLVNGAGIRAIERITGVHRDTISRLGLKVGLACRKIHDAFLHDLCVDELELDELWSFVGKKQRRLTPADRNRGDYYVFQAIDRNSKVIVAYRVGPRTTKTTRDFLKDLRARLTNAPTISSDSFPGYENAMREAFGESGVHYGQIIKLFKESDDKRRKRKPRGQGRPATNAQSHGEDAGPEGVSLIRKKAVLGRPDLSRIGTSYVERSNGTLRAFLRRIVRRSLAFSKCLPNHKASIDLIVTYYNFCHIHRTLGTAPAHRLGVIDRPWTVRALVEVALSVAEEQDYDQAA